MWGKQKQEEEEIKCSEVKAPEIYIEATPRQKIAYLIDEYPHQEWLAYLVGKRSEHGNFFVEDISVPPHAEASAASAEAEPMHIPLNCIGIIHSHHTMGAFHSGTDRAYVDRNFPISVTVAVNNGALVFDAVSCQTTPCGKQARFACVVKYVQPPPLFDKESFLKEAKENIDKGKTTVVEGQWGNGVHTRSYPFQEVQYSGSGQKYIWDRETRSWMPVKSAKKHKKDKHSGRRATMVTNDEVQDIMKRVHDIDGVDITRSEAEDLALKSGGDMSWLWEGV